MDKAGETLGQNLSSLSFYSTAVKKGEPDCSLYGGDSSRFNLVLAMECLDTFALVIIRKLL